MRKSEYRWLVLLAAILMLRLLLAAVLPFADTTESRYAEIARLMASSGDWITPWFHEGVPFWGKPPFSFWLQALSFQLFGVNELAGRLPSWLANIATVWLIFRIGNTLPGNLPVPMRGLLPALIYSSMTLGFISAGTVMTDSFLTLATTLVFSSLIMSFQRKGAVWGWLFFIGLAIGLLSKGPLVVILTGFPVFIWILFTGQWQRLWNALPWLRGIALMLALTLPWYVLAELKTPGFIDYFIIGEHIKRFIVTSWPGDLYGNAHDFPRGTIWIYLFFATFPWGLLVLQAAWRHFRNKENGQPKVMTEHNFSFLLLAAGLTPAIFFTFAGNILWTYVLPGLPLLALITARLISADKSSLPAKKIAGMAIFVPLTVALLGGWVMFNTEALNTEKLLINTISERADLQGVPLYYLNEIPFSAHFYSQRRAKSVTEDELEKWLTDDSKTRVLVAVRKGDKKFHAELNSKANKITESKKYRLFLLPAATDAVNPHGLKPEAF